MGVIPQPLSVQTLSGCFRLEDNFTISCEGPGSLQVGATSARLLLDRHGLHCREEVSHKAERVGVTLRVEEFVESLEGVPNPGEGYELLVSTDGVVVSAQQANGLFYGVQTLLQLIPLQAICQSDVGAGCEEVEQRQFPHEGLVLDGVKIVDAPRFKWRGTLLDVGRHFYSLEFVKRFLDLLAMHKMNRFHWHLVEDQGWRIEIKAFPALTEVGAWRSADGEKPYGGFYRQDEIPEIIAYAKERFIEILPEIELPGHCGSALASYPGMSCCGEAMGTPTEWGIYETVYCAGKEEVFTFLETILGEICELFPFEYLHIGGDECPKERWRSCPKCQDRIKEEGLSNENELQSWFISRISRFLKEKGKKIIGWDEILEGGIPENASVMSWRGVIGGLLAARLGHDVVMCPANHCYLDYRQAPNADEPGVCFALLPLQMVYAFDPIPSLPPHSLLGAKSVEQTTEYASSADALNKKVGYTSMDEVEEEGECHDDENMRQAEAIEKDVSGPTFEEDKACDSGYVRPHLRPLTSKEEERIMGGQACLWTEYVESEETAEYMLLPRLCALSEAVWSPKGSRNWNNFHKKLEAHVKHFEVMGVKYRHLH